MTLHGVILDFDSMQPSELDVAGLKRLPVQWQIYPYTTSTEVAHRIADAQIVLVNKVVLSAELLTQAPALRYIGVLATGTNNIDHAYCKAHNIQVHNVEKYGTEAVSQHTLALLLSLTNRIQANQHTVQEGKWSYASQFCLLDNVATELAGKHLVVLGYGELGKRFSAVCEALGMRVTVAARPGQKSSRPAFDEVLPTADVVSLHCLLSDETAGFMNRKRFTRMKNSSFFINTARGGLVDEAALLWALETQQIAGAGLDVLSQEPPPNTNPLLGYQQPNLIITPHCAWGTVEARQRLFDQALSKLSSSISHGFDDVN